MTALSRRHATASCGTSGTPACPPRSTWPPRLSVAWPCGTAAPCCPSPRGCWTPPRAEIGSTWNAASAHGSGSNPDSKLLLLRHAFETLGCPAVEFRTHWLNHQSREAIARLGAKQDGVLRSHTRTADGQLRDTVVFSILEHEWPMVRNGLEARLAKRR